MAEKEIISIGEMSQSLDFNRIITNLKNLSIFKALTRDWLAYKKKAIEELRKDENHIEFSTSYLYRKYSFMGVGNFKIFELPDNKRGILKKFSGKLVFIACIGTGGRDIRTYIAVEITEASAKDLQLSVISG